MPSVFAGKATLQTRATPIANQRGAGELEKRHAMKFA